MMKSSRREMSYENKIKQLSDAESKIKQLNSDLVHLVEDYGEKKPSRKGLRRKSKVSQGPMPDDIK